MEQVKSGIPNAYNLVRTLDKKGSVPAGMVRVPATDAPVGKLEDFFIGRYEVTNREYKAFVDAGGYRNREYWKHPFVKDGEELTWEEAMREFVDHSGQPGPSTWLGGDYPEGQGGLPGVGGELVRGGGVCRVRRQEPADLRPLECGQGGLHPHDSESSSSADLPSSRPSRNFGRKGPVPVGSLPGVTAYGAYDMAGNVREWCWNETRSGRVIRGGAWEDNTYEFGNVRQAPAMDRSPRNGFRLAFYPNPEKIPGAGVRYPANSRAVSRLSWAEAGLR